MKTKQIKTTEAKGFTLKGVITGTIMNGEQFSEKTYHLEFMAGNKTCYRAGCSIPIPPSDIWIFRTGDKFTLKIKIIKNENKKQSR